MTDNVPEGAGHVPKSDGQYLPKCDPAPPPVPTKALAYITLQRELILAVCIRNLVLLVNTQLMTIDEGGNVD